MRRLSTFAFIIVVAAAPEDPQEKCMESFHELQSIVVGAEQQRIPVSEYIAKHATNASHGDELHKAFDGLCREQGYGGIDRAVMNPAPALVEETAPAAAKKGGAMSHALEPPNRRHLDAFPEPPRRPGRDGPPPQQRAAVAASFLERESFVRAASFLELQEEHAEWAVVETRGTPPAPRGGHCSHLRLEMLHIYGGCGAGVGSRCYNDLHALDLKSNTWHQLHAEGNAPHPVSHPACASAGADLVVFGGYAGSYTNAVSIYDADKRTWTRAKPAGAEHPKPRQGASLNRIANNRFVLFGGSDDAVHFNDVHILEPKGAAWISPPAHCAPTPCVLPRPREGHATAVVGSRLWVFGGVGRVGRTYESLSDVAYLDTETYVWHNPTSQIQSRELAPTGRSLAAAASLGSRILFLGGMSTPGRLAYNEASILDTETFGWSMPMAKGRAPPPLFGSSATLRGRAIFTFGGCGGGKEGRCTNEVQSLQFEYLRKRLKPGELEERPTQALGVAGPGVGSGCPSQCTAHGKCWQGRCLCDPGYQGHDCSLKEECDCNGHGTCEHGRCFCDPGYDGLRCNIVVPCLHDCSGHGECLHGRCQCEGGYTGMDCSEILQCPKMCSGRGICINGQCLCTHGSSGDACEITLPCPGGADNQCHGNGLCWESKCLCHPGWTGDGCEEQLPCPNDCRDKQGFKRGKCALAQCWCDPGFTGEDCSEIAHCLNDCSHKGVCWRGGCECEPGYGGPDCSESLYECANNCTGHGACRLGSCLCLPGWSGESCSEKINCPRDCSKHGICFNGKCACQDGYGGVDCSVELVTCLNDCHHHGVCQMGVCVCDLDWAGVDCNEKRGCLDDCNGNGLCKFGRCYCNPGYDGANCSTRVGCEGDHHCGGHGMCEIGKCWCDPGYYGKNCTLAIECPHDCGGEDQGICHGGQCFCFSGWEGDGCTTPAKCPTDSNGDECSLHGDCVRGQCACGVGWSGDACEIEKTCPADCHGQGRCWDGRCLCFPGFEGEDCGLMVDCPEGCSSHGICRHGKCFCDPGYEGDGCQMPVPCPQMCSHRGICYHGRCFCDPPYGGKGCEYELRCPVANGKICAGQGICHNGACECVAGFAGTACATVVDKKAPLRIAWPQPTTVEEEDDVGTGEMGRSASRRGRPPLATQPLKGDPLLVEDRTYSVAEAAERNGYVGATGGIFNRGNPAATSSTDEQPPTPHGRALLFASQQHAARHLLFASRDGGEVLHEGGGGDHTAPGGGLRSLTAQEAADGATPSVVWPASRRPPGSIDGNEALAAMAAENNAEAAKESAAAAAAAAALGPEGAAAAQPGKDEDRLNAVYYRHFTHVPPAHDDLDEPPDLPMPLVESKGGSPGMEVSTETREEPEKVCLNGCSQRGICWEGRCFCDPGWLGHDCGTEEGCEKRGGDGQCSQHGLCQYGVCWCNPGWEGEACERLVPCPNDCNGHGECHAAKCFCKAGWSGNECNIKSVVADSKRCWSVKEALLIQIPVSLIGLLLGWGGKALLEQRQRAKMREILQQDAQVPFASGIAGTTTGVPVPQSGVIHA